MIHSAFKICIFCVSFLRLVKSFALIYKFIFFLIFKFFYFDHVNTIKLAITSVVVLPVP